MNLPSLENFRVDVFGVFSGIGGLELGFHNEHNRTIGMCEIDDDCRMVLKHRFPGIPIHKDVGSIDCLPPVDVLLAGFPCQPFSQAGPMHGMQGSHALLKTLFDLLARSTLPRHVVLENVPNIVHLDGGEAVAYVTRRLEALGYTWAYRIIDTIEFGLPQRRRRWILVASLDDRIPMRIFRERPSTETVRAVAAYGFYWTEGNRGLGWADDAIPPLKSGSGLSIPSPPAIWDCEMRRMITPNIRDAERLQGFEAGWTDVFGPDDRAAQRKRWKMIGNAVSVPVARFIADTLDHRDSFPAAHGDRFLKRGPWPRAAWGRYGERHMISFKPLPSKNYTPILEFLQHAPQPLSYRATNGFRLRLIASTLRCPEQFKVDLLHHERAMQSPTRS